MDKSGFLVCKIFMFDIGSKFAGGSLVEIVIKIRKGQNTTLNAGGSLSALVFL